MRWHVAIFLYWATRILAERFDEHLELTALPDGKVLGHWTFTTTLEDAEPGLSHAQHYTLFPLGLGQILNAHGASELHLALNAGQWNYKLWGSPPEPSVASGAEIWTWMRARNSTEADARWVGLRNALAGVFCASLGSLDDQRTTTPALSFRPSVPLPIGKHELRHATLPAEHVCTENLTPFVKLLPCKASAGLATLLNPHALFSAPFHGLSVHYTAGALKLAVQAVFTPPRQDWSLHTLLDRSVPAACTVASSSTLSIVAAGAQLDPEPLTDLNGVMQYDLASASYPVEVTIRHPVDTVFSHRRLTPAVSLRRTMTGSAQYAGGLLVQLENARNETVRVSYLETLPWFVTLYLHTLDIRVDEDPRQRLDLLERLSYVPPRAPAPTTLEPILRLPPMSRVTMRFQLERAFLLYTQHPPDAQRGWDLPPAAVTILPPSSPPITAGPGGQVVFAFHGPPERVYAKTLLADLATPDFSMPYNVIIMSSTLVALLFGNVFNLMTRAFVIVNAQ
ncbi:Gpi16 subunit, GPI transamidase component [Exidia glandulosa HHB12029]|uniref:Gpi16 subunit, GPI transamidase component n=1 Tax=Exidia glandulosa HHB12029 TaxID=1314781 RepID=A0A165MXN8_EXIGL|nr:Gpi16 subunit, GPI transamidase component [Exidia glandulosa HHB12029]